MMFSWVPFTFTEYVVDLVLLFKMFAMLPCEKILFPFLSEAELAA